MPRIICGSSVGSMIASIICTNYYDDIPKLLEDDKYLMQAFLKTKYGSYYEMITNILRGEEIFSMDNIKEILRKTCGDFTFKEIHDKFKWNLNITVTDSEKLDEGRLLNYLTAPNVIVWSAAAASCAIPLVFEPVELLIKTDDGLIVNYNTYNQT